MRVRRAVGGGIAAAVTEVVDGFHSIIRTVFNCKSSGPTILIRWCCRYCTYSIISALITSPGMSSGMPGGYGITCSAQT